MALLQSPRCPVCGSNSPVDLLDITTVPVYCNVLWPHREQAQMAAQGSMRLKYCEVCAHVFNAAYDPGLTDYTPVYDNSLHFSPHFSQYAEALAASLVKRYALHGKRLVEIGCGKGDFLMQLCDLGENRGWGFDRSFDPERVDDKRGRRIDFVQDYYTAEHAARLRPDFVCCRHVLEHIADPRSFLAELRRGFGERPDAVLYFEVPNALFTLKDMGIWDLIYEHCAYFTLDSLTQAATSSGFDVLAMGEAFGGQFIFVEMRPGLGRVQATLPEAHQPASVTRYADAFAEQHRAKLEAWHERLAHMAEKGRRAVVWGAGSKGVTFLNMLKDHDVIHYVVDVNPHKQGRFVAGTGQRVVSPEFLRTHSATDVIVMNPVYLNEITSTVHAMGLDVEVVIA